MTNVISTDTERMVFTTADGNEYPLFDASNDASTLNTMQTFAEKTIETLKEQICKNEF